MGERTETEAGAELARLDASQPRRVIGVGVQIALAGLMVVVAVGLGRDQMALRLLLLVLGGLVAYGAVLTWRATAVGLVLTEAALRDGNGRLLAEVPNMREVSRGAFAIKPSHGFSLVLHKGAGFAWVPGMWWRVGKRVGVGGVTPAQPAKYMAEVITAMIAGRGN